MLLYRGTLDHAPDARVAGAVHEEIGFSFAHLAWLLWFGIPFLIVVAWLIFVVLAERQLRGAARLILTRPGSTVLSALAVVVGLLMLALAALFTELGIPLGFALLIFLLPSVAFLGYLVAGASVGRLVLRRWPQSAEHPCFSITIGLLILQVIGLFRPWAGWSCCWRASSARAHWRIGAGGSSGAGTSGGTAGPSRLNHIGGQDPASPARYLSAPSFPVIQDRPHGNSEGSCRRVPRPAPGRSGGRVT